ncbi:TRAP transporter large permease subunit [Neomoorella thermoacetica]|uniref:TRAP transporter large permease subunit n=1 Tax=Neomoorella thermoacetica TaxID=1525 RepID=UPI0030D2C176
MSAIVLLPLLVIIAVLVMRKHMIVAGISGAIVAMIIGHMGLASATKIIMDAIPGMMSMTTPIMYSATALAVAKTGGFDALLRLSRKITGNRVYLVAAAIVLIQALATYAAGLGAGNTMVTGPLAFAAVGAVPELIAGMAIATAASFETSPASAESATISKIAKMDVGTYVNQMFPFTILFWIIGIALAAYGVWRRGRILNEENNEPMSMGQIVRTALPPLYFIIVVVAGKYLNMLFGGYHVFTAPFNMISTLVLATILTKSSMDKMAENLIQGSSFILTRLFAIGVFLGFINILSEIGTFKYIAQIAASAPSFIFVSTAILAGFIVAVPAGAYSVGVISLVVPVLAAVGLTPLQMGLVALAIGMGTQMSPVQINVAALSQTFEMEIESVVRNNAPYVFGVLVLLIILGLFL